LSNQPWSSTWGVEITRGGMVESFHQVAVCILDADRNVMFSAGDIDAPVFLRSTAKPFIAAAALAAGVQQAFALEPREIAVMAASHGGQSFHIEAVRSILRRIGMDESALRCGTHPPYNEMAAAQLQQSGEAAGAVHNNCSGKHAGILALCKLLGADPSTYLEASNPAQQYILDFCARMADQRASDFELAVDGCGIPVYATSLRNAARAFVRLGTLDGVSAEDAHALRTVREAMMRHPEYVAGTGEFDTRLMTAAPGNLVCKAGAEGVHGAAFLQGGVGMALKVLDGAARARAPAALAAVRRLGLLDEALLVQLADLERPVVYNRAGRAVGEVRAGTAI